MSNFLCYGHYITIKPGEKEANTKHMPLHFHSLTQPFICSDSEIGGPGPQPSREGPDRFSSLTQRQHL